MSQQYSYPDGNGGFALVPVKNQGSPTIGSPSSFAPLELPKIDLSGAARLFGGAADAVGGFVNNLSDPAAGDAAQEAVLARMQKQHDDYITLANDLTKPANARLAAAQSAKSVKTMMDNNPLTVKRANQVATTNTANKQLVELGGAPQPSATPSSLSFGPARSQMLAPTPISTSVKPKTGELPDITGFLSAQLGEPVTLTSGYRDPSHNAAAGGVKNSAHMETSPTGVPLAYDFTPSKSKTTDAAIKLATNLHGQFDQIISEGDHVHVSFDPKGRGEVLEGNAKSGYKHLLPSMGGGLQTISPTVQPGDITHFPGMVAMDPSQVGAMIPNARHLPTNIKLPDAPQQDTPSDITPLSLLDKASLLAPMKEALAVKPRDASHDTWDRFASLLQGAAQGGVEAGRAPTMGQLLLNAGAGAGRGYKTETLRQKGEQDKYDEMVRQTNIALAQQGFNIDLKNVDIGNQNIGKADQSKENKRVVKYENATALFNAKLKALDLNLENTRLNVGADNTRDLTRANAVIGATEGVAAATNKGNLGQTELNLSGAGTAGIEKGIAGDLASVGLAPTDEKNPHMIGARQAAMGVRMNQPDAAFNGLAHDLVYNGGAAEILAPAKGDTPEVAKSKSTALRAIKTAKKPEDAQGAVQTLAQLMTSNHSAAVQIAKTYAGRGYPSAKIIMNGLMNSGMSDQDKKAYGIN